MRCRKKWKERRRKGARKAVESAECRVQKVQVSSINSRLSFGKVEHDCVINLQKNQIVTLKLTMMTIQIIIILILILIIITTITKVITKLMIVNM